MTKISRQARLLRDMGQFYEPFIPDWAKMCTAFNQPAQHCALVNRHFEDAHKYIENLQLDLKEHNIDCNAMSSQVNSVDGGSNKHMYEHAQRFGFSLKVFSGFTRLPSPGRLVEDRNKLLPYYLMDMSSLLPVLALDLVPSDRVLDMCSAPGGKAVAISQFLSPSHSQLVCNEPNKDRFVRLEKVLKSYTPKKWRVGRVISSTGWKGDMFGREEGDSFDKVLIDAPCSAERHAIRDGFVKDGWSVRKMKSNSITQLKLLRSGLHAVRAGGCVVYCTCSISPVENDQVVEETLQLFHDEGVKVECVPPESCRVGTVDRFGKDEFFVHEGSAFGTLVLPSDNANWGPIYFAKLVKKS